MILRMIIGDPMLRRWLSTSLADEAAARQWLDVQVAGWIAATRFSFAVVADADDRSLLGHVVVKVATAGVATHDPRPNHR